MDRRNRKTTKNEFLFQGFNLQDKEMDGDEEALERYEIDFQSKNPPLVSQKKFK